MLVRERAMDGREGKVIVNYFVLTEPRSVYPPMAVSLRNEMDVKEVNPDNSQ